MREILGKSREIARRLRRPRENQKYPGRSSEIYWGRFGRWGTSKRDEGGERRFKDVGEIGRDCTISTRIEGDLRRREGDRGGEREREREMESPPMHLTD